MLERQQLKPKGKNIFFKRHANKYQNNSLRDATVAPGDREMDVG